MPTSSSNPWIDWLRDLLCEMYEAWGGDCDDLGLNATEWINTLEAEYNSTGAPQFSNEQERRAFLELLDNTEEHLDKPQNSLSQQDDQDLRDLIANLRGDIGSAS